MLSLIVAFALGSEFPPHGCDTRSRWVPATRIQANEEDVRVLRFLLRGDGGKVDDLPATYLKSPQEYVTALSRRMDVVRWVRTAVDEADIEWAQFQNGRDSGEALRTRIGRNAISFLDQVSRALGDERGWQEIRALSLESVRATEVRKQAVLVLIVSPRPWTRNYIVEILTSQREIAGPVLSQLSSVSTQGVSLAEQYYDVEVRKALLAYREHVLSLSENRATIDLGDWLEKLTKQLDSVVLKGTAKSDRPVLAPSPASQPPRIEVEAAGTIARQGDGSNEIEKGPSETMKVVAAGAVGLLVLLVVGWGAMRRSKASAGEGH